MDFFTISILGATVMALMAGDAVISASTLSVSVGLPPAVQQTGLTRSSAEDIFVAEVAQISAIPSGVPVPSPRVAYRRTVIGALSEPLRLTELTMALQDLFGLEPVRISATMLQQGSGLQMQIVIAEEGRPSKLLQITRADLDAVALIRTAAREAFAEVAPFRVTLARLKALLDGSESDSRAVRVATESLLRRNWLPRENVEHSALHSLASVLELLEGDRAASARSVALADSFPDALPTARAFYALNGAFLSLLAGDLAQARTLTARGIELSRRHNIRGFPAYSAIQRGLLAWAEGRLSQALAFMQEALVIDPLNRNAQIYVAWLRHEITGTNAPFDRTNLPMMSSRSPMVPGLMSSVFLMDPRARVLERAPYR